MDHLGKYRKHISTRHIYLSLVIGVFINMIPSGGLLPDVVALLIVYWLLTTPDQINLVTVFVLGLIMDISSGSLLGQNALAYVITSYIILRNRRKLILYNYGWQTLVVFSILLLNKVIIMTVAYIISKKLPSMEIVLLGIFFPTLIGAFFWSLLNKFMIFAYRPRTRTK